MAKVQPYTEAKANANKRYDDKTYKRIMIKLRIEEDADIIESFMESKDHGYTSREWLRQLYEG